MTAVASRAKATPLPKTLNLRSVALAVEASLLSESFSEFVKKAWHVLEPTTPLRWGWSLDAICEHLSAVTEGQIQYLLMNVPPGCMKSLLTGVFWPAWEWTDKKRRGLRYLGTSHKQDLAVRDNLKCRRLIQSRWYQERWPDVKLTSDQNAKTKFENSDTGFREAMAFQSMTGSRGDRVLLDDPLSVDSANSEADILSAKLTFLEALPTRVNNEESAIVVIMQRLHEEDTSGIILSRELGYTHLMLPMRFEIERRCHTSIGFVDPRKKDGDLLFPERFPEKEVKRLERTMGEYAVAGQLQQRPAPRGGGMFKDKFLQLWPHGRDLPNFLYIVQSYDTAFTENTANDPCACTVWGVFKFRERRCALLLDAWDDHLNYPKLRKKVITDWKARYGGTDKDALDPGRRADAILVENKGSGISIIQELNAAGVPAIKYNPGLADKFSRAQQALPMYELGCFYVLESGIEPGLPIKWARPFKEQLSKFGPGVTAHDDYVDTFTQSAIYLRDTGHLELEISEEDEVEEVDYNAQKRKPNPYGQ